MPPITTANAVTGVLAAAFVLAMCVLGMSLANCTLHNPVPCTGGVYPDPCAAAHRDAGADAK